MKHVQSRIARETGCKRLEILSTLFVDKLFQTLLPLKQLSKIFSKNEIVPFDSESFGKTYTVRCYGIKILRLVKQNNTSFFT